MKLKTVSILCILTAFFVAGCIFLYNFSQSQPNQSQIKITTKPDRQTPVIFPEQAIASKQKSQQAAPKCMPEQTIVSYNFASESLDETNSISGNHPTDIEEIKRQIYDLDIEYVEDIDAIEDIVQTGNKDTRPLWGGNWDSVDDYKSVTNSFQLEPQTDETYVFIPDEQTAKSYTFFETPKSYTYDPEKHEFYWDLDYYGKTITHKAKFINDNVLVLMLISGDKVDMDIYQKHTD